MERDYHHPFSPYPIQTLFMDAVYECIDEGKVGVLESPTGTGKSLSLICGSLTWLREHKRKVFEEGLNDGEEDDDEPQWMLEHARQEKRRVALQQREELEARLAKIRVKERRLRERYESGEPLQKRQAPDQKDAGEDDESRFVLDDYESDDGSNRKSKAAAPSELGLSAETQALMKKLGMPLSRSDPEEETELQDELKIFYCSRTHSQLSQFSSELNRVRMPPAISPEPPRQPVKDGPEENDLHEEFKHLTLGSRKNLCINPKVKSLGSATAINERCLELQQPGTSSDCKCPYLPNKENEALVNDFRDHALAKIRDIEDLGAVGKRLGICPYYASRAAIVTLPYPLLLQKSAREALNLSMKGHVVIIDEAHNLMDAITGIYSVSVSLAQLQRSRGQLTIYLQKFRNRLKGKNRVYVAQTVRLLDSIVGFLEKQLPQLNQAEGVVQISDLMAGKGVDQINLYKLMRYLQESKLARKVDGYIVHTEQQQQQQQSKADAKSAAAESRKNSGTMPVLTHIQGFLLALMNPSAEGRFFYTKNDEEHGVCLKYMLLDPTHHFKEIVEEARAVILAGGTMSPMSDYEQHLFPYLPRSQIKTLSCGHVVPPSSLFAVPVTQSLNGVEFDFTFEKRNSERMITELGHAIHAFINAIPDGVVVFFPSYAYLDQCISIWKRVPFTPSPPSPSSPTKTLFDALTSTKPLFQEAKSRPQPQQPRQPTSTTAETVLDAYTAAVSSGGGRGALLLAVVGGTLSEGINFSDALGRGVIIVGLPFPNPHSAEWKARMAYIESKAAAAAAAAGAEGKRQAREFYENACMRAVNQCVGRAIRHRGDYAAILLVDRRFGTERVGGKLPGWIRGSLGRADGVRGVVGGLRGFFGGKGGR
ncbi:DNA repair helicase [Saccharata proteae CBS 121410]|uniref:ATP-dependent DNA helicase CHL1 n=1 Tax=Saccharata proteae CBS 121410 TaxID=1314787 RepID=A0A9P4HZ46_9PEZI|nr:DNA repair helicase [Saccharata proteae CBS 121410]